jgi:DNA-binding response OmpR family regulator
MGSARIRCHIDRTNFAEPTVPSPYNDLTVFLQIASGGGMKDPDLNFTYDFGRFSLNLRERRLLFSGEPVLLTPKAFETLAALVERNGHVVTKNELMELVWPDSFVE